MYRILHSTCGYLDLERLVQDALANGATLIGAPAFGAGWAMQAVNTTDAPAKTMGEFNNRTEFAVELAAYLNNGYVHRVVNGAPVSHYTLSMTIRKFLIEKGIN